MLNEAQELRSGFEREAHILREMSPLLGQWTEPVAGGAINDSALSYFTHRGYEAASWVAVKRFFTACLTMAQLTDDAFLRYVPTFNGQPQVNEQFDQDLAELVDTNKAKICGLFPRMLVANDPLSGIQMWQAATPWVPQEASLLIVGAGAGLELVADSLAPDLNWHPRERRGVDTSPIDLNDPVSRAWLLAVCPPDDVTRADRTRHAITLARQNQIRVLKQDAVRAITQDESKTLVIMGGSLMCMLEDPTTLIAACRARSGQTFLVSQEVVAVHRRAGLGEGLEQMTPDAASLKVVSFNDGRQHVLV